MKIVDTDLIKVKELYNQFIKLMVKDFNDNYDVNIENALAFIAQFYKELISNIKREKHPEVSNLPSLGIYCLCGFNVCRTTNTLSYDFLNEIGFDLHLQFVHIDENNDWHIGKNMYANHVVVCIDKKASTIYFDLVNDLCFETVNDKINVISIDSKDIKIDYDNYKEIINQISNTLDKYLLYENLGIERVYTY